MRQQDDRLRRALTSAVPSVRRAARARKQAREGAYRKAVVGIKGEVKQYTSEEQRSWAKRLVPQSRGGGEVFASRPGTAPAPVDPGVTPTSAARAPEGSDDSA